MTNTAISYAQASSGFANALSAMGGFPLKAYRALSSKIGGGIERIVMIESREIISAELNDLSSLISSSIDILFKIYIGLNK